MSSGSTGPQETVTAEEWDRRLREEFPLPDEATEMPVKLAVDANGFCWRVFADGTWSMARINPDNSPVPQPVTYYVPEVLS